jgi:hypothetical protein
MAPETQLTPITPARILMAPDTPATCAEKSGHVAVLTQTICDENWAHDSVPAQIAWARNASHAQYSSSHVDGYPDVIGFNNLTF